MTFEYEIKLDKNGIPYIHIPEDYVDNPEDKFMALEVTRYVLTTSLAKNRNKISESGIKSIEQIIENLGVISEEMAQIIKQQMENKGVFTLNTQTQYHIVVDTIKERDKLNYEGIFYNNKIYKRTEGLKVLVMEDKSIYELKNGIDNENWVKL